MKVMWMCGGMCGHGARGPLDVVYSKVDPTCTTRATAADVRGAMRAVSSHIRRQPLTPPSPQRLIQPYEH